MYAYCGNNSVDGSDPSGLNQISPETLRGVEDELQRAEYDASPWWKKPFLWLGQHFSVSFDPTMMILDDGGLIEPKFVPEVNPWRFRPEVDVDLRPTTQTLKEALDMAFKRTQCPREEFKVTKWGKDVYGKTHPVEWRHPSGAEVNIDYPHLKNGPTVPHVGYQSAGKRGLGGAVRGHILLNDVPRGR